MPQVGLGQPCQLNRDGKYKPDGRDQGNNTESVLSLCRRMQPECFSSWGLMLTQHLRRHQCYTFKQLHL
jgi:hypothetical protein